MANAAKLVKNTPARILLLGYPGGGKTGALAALANAGLKLRILAFDKAANFAPLLNNVDPDKLENIDIVFLEDKMRSGPKAMEPVGVPSAFADGLKMLDHWKYTDEDGTEVDLGRSRDWGPDTVVVVDSLTSMGDASMRRATVMANRTVLNRSQPVWGHAMSDQMAFLDKLTGSGNRHHVIVTAHIKPISPDDVGKDDNDTTKEIKEQMIELVPTRLYPTALGKQNARNGDVGARFGTGILLAEAKYKRGKLYTTPDNPSGRYIHHTPRPELDLRVAALNLPEEIPISHGLLTIFKATTGGPEYWFGQEGAPTPETGAAGPEAEEEKAA